MRPPGVVASKVAGQLRKGPQSLSVDSGSLKLTLLVHAPVLLSPPSVFCSSFPAVFFFLSITLFLSVGSTPFKDQLNQGGLSVWEVPLG